jgi:hypothetical protein
MNLKLIATQVRSHGWTLRAHGGIIELLKNYRSKNNVKIVSSTLMKVSGGYLIKYPESLFTSKTATFGPNEENEMRKCRSASVLHSLLCALKETELWDIILNLGEFAIVNSTYNKNINVKFAQEKLDRWLSSPIKKAA